jgi:hypothetical protein
LQPGLRLPKGCISWGLREKEILKSDAYVRNSETFVKRNRIGRSPPPADFFIEFPEAMGYIDAAF